MEQTEKALLILAVIFSVVAIAIACLKGSGVSRYWVNHTFVRQDGFVSARMQFETLRREVREIEKVQKAHLNYSGATLVDRTLVVSSEGDIAVAQRQRKADE